MFPGELPGELELRAAERRPQEEQLLGGLPLDASDVVLLRAPEEHLPGAPL